MVRVEALKKLTEILKKYRYVVLVLAIGVVLMLLPEDRESEASQTKSVAPTAEQTSVSTQLEEVLCQIEGAGKVKVMLTVAVGEQTIFQTDTEESASADNDSVKVETVLINDNEKNQTGVIKQMIPEQYLGAIIVCQGADNPSVRLAIVQAVANVTGLGTDKISVLKMK